MGMLAWNDSICVNSSSRPPGTADGPVPYPPGKITFAVVMIVLQSVNIVLCVGLYWYFRKSTEHTRLRPISIVQMLAIMCVCDMLSGPINTAYQTELPCAIMLFASFLIIPFGAGAIIAKFSIFMLLSKYTYVMHLARQDMDPTTIASTSSDGQEADPIQPHLALLLLCSSGQTTAKERARMLRVLKFFLQPAGHVLIATLVVAPFAAIAFILLSKDPAIFAGCVGCAVSDPTILLVLALSGALVVSVAGAFAWLVRSLPDRWGLGRETRYVVLGAFVGFLSFLGSDFDPLNDNAFDFGFALTASLGYMLFVSSVWQLKIGRDKQRALQALRGKRHRPRSKDSLEVSSLHTSQTSPGTPVVDKVKLNDVLADTELVKKFETFLVQELGVESLFFLQDVAKWKGSYFDNSPATRSHRARKIISTYIDTSGSFGVNLPAEVHLKVMQFARGKADVPLTAFDSAVEEIKQLLTMGALQRFLAALRAEASSASSSGAVAPIGP